MTDISTTAQETPICDDDGRSILGFPRPGRDDDHPDYRERGILVVDGRPYEVFASREDGCGVLEVPSLDYRVRGSSIDEGTIEANRDYARHLIASRVKDGRGHE